MDKVLKIISEESSPQGNSILHYLHLRGKHCLKPHCYNGIVDTLGPGGVQESQLKTVGYYHTPFYINFRNEMKKGARILMKSFGQPYPKCISWFGGRFNSLRTVSSNWKENGIIANFRKGNNGCVHVHCHLMIGIEISFVCSYQHCLC